MERASRIATWREIAARVLIFLCVVGVVSGAARAGKSVRPGDVAGDLGYMAGWLMWWVGLYYGVRWKMLLSGHTHRVGRQALAAILFWLCLPVAVVGLVIVPIALVEAVGRGETLRNFMSPVQAIALAIPACSAWVSWRWLRRLRGEERARAAAETGTPAPYMG